MKFKQSIVVRTDLKMGRGKIAAQVAHASCEAVFIALERAIWREWVHKWRMEGQKKVVLKASSESELLELYSKALKKGLPCSLIRDAGLTQLPPNTLTAIAIGPAPEEMVNELTSHLKLL
ncbi:peptidyl-tRNA hydrolase [Ignicoccus islandicus DSM 13165]|uniref:Peptidyl-tRNA hydrolase n=1 Tax=Ignicoccus islandicus DSM 13165 TaxID=940295 RepID=A0A0U3E9S5_9CREN|nr:peptidyl-tRNA hydrolase Pth2 [Ignicoccus islandicus]ALU12062.1 peptidyl-tRNA hydrolase [Ignicoccus islandicus DSM 13165]